MKNILFILFLSFSCTVSSQTLNYEITSGKSHIGEFSIKRLEKNDIVQINGVGEVRVSFFFSFDIKFKLSCTYKENELLFSSVTTYVNGDINSTNIIEKNGDNYSITEDGHLSKLFGKINYSGALLFFREPKKTNTVFSEYDNIENPISEIKENEYQIAYPTDGYRGKYKYKNGVLETTTIDHTLITFTLTRK